MSQPTFRFAVFAAVSTDEQVTDKGSLEDQVVVSRAAGTRQGGAEAAGPYIADGYSRTGYYNLDDALDDIPPLKKCVAEMNQYDVLIVKNFDRLGSLGAMLFHLFSKHKKQLHSVQQATPIYLPSVYDPNSDTSVAMMISVAGISQTYRIQKIVDAFRVGIPKRARDGNYATAVPYGYIKKDKHTLLLDERAVSLISQWPGWFLGGMTIAEITRKANASGIPPRSGKKWYRDSVEYILQNPFYAGKTFSSRRERDPRTGEYVAKQDYELYEGRHEPIWDWETYLRIMAEFKRRRKAPYQSRYYNFTKLLICSVCGQRLYITYGQKKSYKYWRCPAGHVSIRDKIANSLVADEIIRLYSHMEYSHSPKEESRNHSQREMAKVMRDLVRLEQAYFAGAYSPTEYATLKKNLESRRDELLDEQKQEAEAQRRITDRERSISTLRELLPYIHTLIEKDDPRIVNFHLSRVVKLTVYPNKTIKGELLGY